MSPIPRPAPPARPPILAALLVVVIVAALAAPWAAEQATPGDEARWARSEDERLSRVAADVGRSAAALGEALSLATTRAADSLGLAAAGAEPVDARRAFEALAGAARSARTVRTGLARVRDPDGGAEWGILLEENGRDVAWWGRPLAAASAAPRDGLFLDSGRIRTVLGVAASFSGGRRVITTAPFDVAAVSPGGVDVRLVPAGAPIAAGHERRHASSSFTIGGSSLGSVIVTGDTYEGALARARARGRAARWCLAAIATALAAALFWRRARAERGEPPVGAARPLAASLAFVWGARALLAWIRPPPSAFGSALFDPAGFAGAAPLGLLRSPADLFFSVVAIAATVWLLDRGLAPRPREESLPASALRIALALAGGAAIWKLAGHLVADAMYAAAPRLFDAPLPEPSPVALLLLVSLSLAGFAIFRVLVLLVRLSRATDRPVALLVPLALLAGYGLLASATRTIPSLAPLADGAWVRAARTAVPFLPLLAAALAAALGLERIARRGRPAEYARSALLLLGACLAILPGVDRGLEARDRDRIAEAAARFAAPRDEWRRFVLEETLEFFSARRTLSEALARGAPANPENLAFTEWSESPLASLGYECALEILDGAGAVVSRFSVGLPAESGYRATFAFRDARESRRPVVLAGRSPIGREVIDTYLGATPLLGPDSTVVGAVVVTVPYFFESLAFATRPESRRPLLLGAGAPPSSGLEGRLIVSRFENGALTASSDPTIPPGLPLPPDLARVPDGRFWDGPLYGGPETTLLAHPASSADADARTRGATAATALAFTLRRSGPRELAARLVHVALVGAAILAARALVGLALAALRRERRTVTFRGKLLAAFLVIAVIPALLMGALTHRQTRARAGDAARREALAGLDAVRSRLRERSVGEATRLSETTLIRRLALGLEPATAIDLETGLQKFSIFSAGGGLLLQNGVVPDVPRDLVRRVASTLSPETFFSPEDGLSIVTLVPIVFEGEAEPGKGALLLRSAVDNALLAETGEEGDRDLIAYGQAGLAASNRPELFQSELLPRRMPADAFVDCVLNRKEAAFGTGVLAGVPYVAAVGALAGLSGEPLGALAVPLLFRQREIDEEVGRALARILYLTAVVLVFVSFLASLVADRIARPVAEISAGTKRISRGELAFSLPRAGGGELGELVDSFNRMTEELLRSRERLLERTRTIEAILGNMTTGVLALDRDGTITALNRGGARILGLAAGAGIGRPAEWLRDGVRDGIADTLEAIGDAPRGVLEREIALQRARTRGAKDAPDAPEADAPDADPTAEAVQSIRAVGTRLLDEAGAEIGRVLVFEDLTELIRTKKLMAWGEMARQVAHEIKNPLTPMKLSAQQIRSAFHDGAPQFPQILEEGTQAIIDEIESLRRIATEFSAFARMPRRLVRDEDLNEIVRESARFYGSAGGVEVALELDAGAPRVRVDRSEMKRVLVNLIENAVQASRAGGRVVVRTRVVAGARALDAAGAPPGGFVAWSGRPSAADRFAAVAVEDAGCGIAAEFRTRLFEPNFSTKTNGTGLGLAICKGIVEDHGGAIRVASAAGRGTEVVVVVPGIEPNA